MEVPSAAVEVEMSGIRLDKKQVSYQLRTLEKPSTDNHLVSSMILCKVKFNLPSELIRDR
jgi:hypothetical protein